MLAGREATIFGDGSQQRDYVYIDDIIDATLRAADREPGDVRSRVGPWHVDAGDLPPARPPDELRARPGLRPRAPRRHPGHLPRPLACPRTLGVGGDHQPRGGVSGDGGVVPGAGIGREVRPMATNQYGEGTPIQAPTGDKAIIEGQEQQYAFAQAAMPAKGDPSPNQHPGFGLDALRLWIAAAHAPLWSELVGPGDFNWMSRRRLGPRSSASAVVRRFDHQPGTTRCRCEYRETHLCEAAAGNLQDGIRRWRADDGNVEPFRSDADIEAGARTARILRLGTPPARLQRHRCCTATCGLRYERRAL